MRWHMTTSTQDTWPHAQPDIPAMMMDHTDLLNLFLPPNRVWPAAQAHEVNPAAPGCNRSNHTPRDTWRMQPLAQGRCHCSGRGASCPSEDQLVYLVMELHTTGHMTNKNKAGRMPSMAWGVFSATTRPEKTNLLPNNQPTQDDRQKRFPNTKFRKSR